MISIISWWYGRGWTTLLHRIAERIGGVNEFFSITLLFKTLFDPFRQIDATQVDGPLQMQLRAFGDRLFSRIIGAFMRSVVIVAGLIAIGVMSIVGLAQLAVWPLVPWLPIVGLALSVMRVGA